jgi:hypothetical protein
LNLSQKYFIKLRSGFEISPEVSPSSEGPSKSPRLFKPAKWEQPNFPSVLYRFGTGESTEIHSAFDELRQPGDVSLEPTEDAKGGGIRRQRRGSTTKATQNGLV